MIVRAALQSRKNRTVYRFGMARAAHDHRPTRAAQRFVRRRRHCVRQGNRRASGATRGTVSGQTVTFAPCAVLPAREVITYTVKARAVRTGDARFKVQMTSALLTTPVTEEESTQVY